MMEFSPQVLQNIGYGGVAFLFLIGCVAYYIMRIEPERKKNNENLAVVMKVIENNNSALSEVSKSNQNVASALELLKNSMDTVHEILEKVDERSERMENGLIKMNERIKFIKGVE